MFLWRVSADKARALAHDACLTFRGSFPDLPLWAERPATTTVPVTLTTVAQDALQVK